MLEHFGGKVKVLRLEKRISREDLCGDESELSVRQLARIELGQSIPSLSKVIFIAKALNVSVGYLTDGADLELPKRYKELKYLILRTPTYMDDGKLQVREEQFDEIFEDYYDKLPEEEKIIIEYFLIKQKDIIKAEQSFMKACLFAQMTADQYLENKLIQEWEKDVKSY